MREHSERSAYKYDESSVDRVYSISLIRTVRIEEVKMRKFQFTLKYIFTISDYITTFQCRFDDNSSLTK